MGRGYSGNHPRYSGERYDAKQAYNKDLTASARLHYLENDRNDHDSPHHMSVNERLDDSFGMGQNTGSAPSPMNNRADRLRGRAQKRSERSGAESGDYDYEDKKVTKLLAKAKMLDERSGTKAAKKGRDIEAPIAGDFDFGGAKVGRDIGRSLFDIKGAKVGRDIGRSLADERSGELRDREMDDMMDNRPDSPFNACAKDEGGSGCIQEMGGAWRVISNKTDKPWPAKYGSKSKAESALRGYHAG
jgi:hypothetical protein|tara:strand:- start:11679 stop:12413 length:735 start_codon:yes stop_codon:yes gene_type:complete